MNYNARENELKKSPSSELLEIHKVNSLEDYIKARDQLEKMKELFDETGEKKPENDDAAAVTKSIIKQEKQIKSFIDNLANYDSEYFAKNLDLLLRANSLKISELESILRVSAGYISRTIGNESKRRLSVDILWKIAELFRVNIDDLLNRDLNAPTKDLKQVVSFVKKLYEETESEKIRWENIGTEPNEKNSMFFIEENEVECFLPTGVPLFLCDLIGGYSVDIPMGTIYLFEEKISGDRDDYSLYFYDESILEESGGEEDPLIKISISSSDPSRILEAECKKLVNAIKTHERDFFVSAEAKRLMDKYLNGVYIIDDEEELPFK